MRYLPSVLIGILLVAPAGAGGEKVTPDSNERAMEPMTFVRAWFGYPPYDQLVIVSREKPVKLQMQRRQVIREVNNWNLTVVRVLADPDSKAKWVMLHAGLKGGVCWMLVRSEQRDDEWVLVVVPEPPKKKK